MKFIVKESNYLTLLMTREFESLPKPLLIEIVRKKEAQNNTETKMADNQVIKSFESFDHSLEFDMKNFLKRGEFCDIHLVLGDVEIKAHKSILAARSRYFEAMFRSFMPKDNRMMFQIGNTTPTESAVQS